MESQRLDSGAALTALIEPCLRGDRLSREQLARGVMPRLRKTATLLAESPSDVDDLVQNTLLSMFTGLESFRREARFTTWLDRIAVNTAKQHYRRAWWRLFSKSSDLNDVSVACQQPSPESAADSARGVDQIVEQLRFIKPDKRTALVMWAAWGYSVEEIAQICECSLEAAKKRLQHGRAELHDRMKKNTRGRNSLEELAP